MRTRLLVPHVKGCTALVAVERGDWATPWWFNGERMYRKSDGRKGGPSLFLVLACNSTECNARKIVHHGDLCEAVEVSR